MHDRPVHLKYTSLIYDILCDVKLGDALNPVTYTVHF